jgi:hypothetical protein
MSVSFSIDVKPLFREKDREAMIQAGNFDLYAMRFTMAYCSDRYFQELDR